MILKRYLVTYCSVRWDINRYHFLEFHLTPVPTQFLMWRDVCYKLFQWIQETRTRTYDMSQDCTFRVGASEGLLGSLDPTSQMQRKQLGPSSQILLVPSQNDQLRRNMTTMILQSGSLTFIKVGDVLSCRGKII